MTSKIICSSLLFSYYFMCMSILSACMLMCHMNVLCPERPGRDIRSPGTEVTDGSEPPCRCWHSAAEP